MDETANAIINNLVDVVNPAIENIGEISRTIVQETTNVGFAYVVVGCVFVGIAILILSRIAWIVKKKQQWNDSSFAMLGVSCLFAIIGFSVIMANMMDWIAPTKMVLKEVIRQF